MHPYQTDTMQHSSEQPAESVLPVGAPKAPTPADLWAMGVTETHRWEISVAGARDYNESTRVINAPTAADAITAVMTGRNPGCYAQAVKYLGTVKIDRTGGLIP